MKLTKYILLLNLILASSICFAQVKFEAKASKTKLGINERLRIDFEMNKDGDNFVPPSFKDFTVVGGPNTSVSNYWANGKRSFTKTYSYFLSPKKQGSFTIKQAQIEIEGQVYKTFPITIKVTEAIEKPKDPNDPAYLASQNIHLVAEVSKTNPYLNEAITVVYKLYVALDTGVNGWRDKETPRFNDFWNQNIEVKAFRPLRGQYNGEEYQYVVLKKYVLYPQKTGQLKLEPYVLDLTVEVPTSRYDIFGNRIVKKVPQTITAGKRTINVLPLPEEGKPADFNGAVGLFELDVTTNKVSLDAGESLEAKVQVSGKGNLKLFELPKLTLPSSLEVYEPEHQENIRTNLGGMQGRSQDTYTIVPQYKGKYPIPAVSFSYFNPEAKAYRTLTSKEIIIDVVNGPSSVGSEANTSSSTVKQAVTTNSNTFAFIKTKSNWIAKNKLPFFKSTLFWSLLLVPFVFIPIAILVRRGQEKRNADVIGNKRRKADRLAKKYLSTAKKALGQKEAFYVALEKAFHNYLKAKLHIETSDFNKEKIESLLVERNVDKDTVSEFISILENCELARYTPITQVTMENDYQKSVKTIGQIDKQIQ
ncbi:oxygen tolerance protein BatD [Winogradskyella wandonensis]|uniref:Oxygen tolerance protein BatD n=1 Tax=Winogradskyella wandonensis TaxID=1442586 RepID=A0A4R1KSL7_9FLAO|nr:BatD family protein [Winogradskyella wandonensis]TCK68024.1 oxygen tolerance protein BatD [Winogradskyella wandonensis]